MPADTPFHPGEQWVQEAVGVRRRAEAVGTGFIRPEMPMQHQDFFPLLPWLFVGTVEGEGQPHASVVVGTPGFVHAPDAKHLVVAAQPLPGDPLEGTLRVGAGVGILGLEPLTRRRNRANGTIVRHDDGGFEVEVSQSFGNCPKYIQPRPLVWAPTSAPNAAPDRATAPTPRRLDRLDDALIRWIERADTCFIASARPAAGGHDVDVSHRGGPPGFVRVDDAHTLSFADFPGNNFFNTLGNLHLHPRAGLLFMDVQTGDRMHIAAEAAILWERDARRVQLRVLSIAHASGA